MDWSNTMLHSDQAVQRHTQACCAHATRELEQQFVKRFLLNDADDTEIVTHTRGTLHANVRIVPYAGIIWQQMQGLMDAHATLWPSADDTPSKYNLDAFFLVINNPARERLLDGAYRGFRIGYRSLPSWDFTPAALGTSLYSHANTLGTCTTNLTEVLDANSDQMFDAVQPYARCTNARKEAELRDVLSLQMVGVFVLNHDTKSEALDNVDVAHTYLAGILLFSARAADNNANVPLQTVGARSRSFERLLSDTF